MRKSDLTLYKKLLFLKESEIWSVMNQYLNKKYKNVIATKDYIVAIGDIPIALVAHMDTVFNSPPIEDNTFYDPDKGVIWSSAGAGHDDRAGIFAIIKILQSGYNPSVILTTGEEQGGIGATNLAALEKCPIPNLKYMIELDRQGSDDCVFYDCNCPEFISYIESFGFKKQLGSFSDISFLMPIWEICGVNLSIGYENEHSFRETLNVNHMFNTIEKVKKMLSEKVIPNFQFELFEINLFGESYHCSKCQKKYYEFELFPVKTLDDKIKFYCPDCLFGNVEWCDNCHEAYEVAADSNTNDKIKLCKECAENICSMTLRKPLNQ